MMDDNKERKQTPEGTSPAQAGRPKTDGTPANDADRLAEDTLVFRREPIERNIKPQNPSRNMQHTAEIRGGAVIRPLKKSGSTPVNPAISVNRPKQAAMPSANGVNGQANRPPMQESPAVNQNRAGTPASSQPVQKPVGQIQYPKAMQNSARKQTASQPINHPAAKHIPADRQRTALNNGDVRRRTENDDYIIDESTYKRTERTAKRDSAFADSATSAVMSLVKAVVYIVAIIAVSVGLSVFVINTANDVFKFVVEDKLVTVEIPEYASVDDVADALYDAGAIKYKWSFKLWTELKDSGAEFVPGVYDVSTSLNYDYLRATFKKSTKRVEVRVTIPEGYTVDEIIELLSEKGVGTKDALADVINNYDFDYPFLDELTVTEDRIWRLEGYLFPDTYNFYLDTDADTNASEVVVISKLLDNFNRKFASEYYDRCKDLGITVDQAVILASMIEKETRYADELGDVSSVFHNRLKYSASFPYLNSDATIMYAIAHDTGSRLDTMTGNDTSYDTPYNTYTNKGLPPGPIANPGLNSIKYALYPNNTGYFYFVSDSNGHMLFGKTEAEHIRNINTAREN